MARLPDLAVQGVKEFSDQFYDDHLWVKAFLYNARGYGEGPIDADRLDQDDKSNMFLLVARFEAFEKKYAAHHFNPKELAYATWMMLSHNKQERMAAIEDAQEIVRRAQEELRRD